MISIIQSTAYAGISAAFMAGRTLPVGDLLQVYSNVAEVLPDPVRSDEVSRLLGKYERSVGDNLNRAWLLLQDWAERAEKLVAQPSAVAIQTSAKRFIAIAPEYERTLGWVPIEETPTETRELVRALRNKLSELYDCKFPKYAQEITPGFRNSMREADNPIFRAIKTGKIAYSNAIPAKRFWYLVIKLFFGVMRFDNRLLPIHLTNEYETLIYSTVEKIENWAPLESVQPSRREFVRLLRRQAILLFGGRLPSTGFETEDGWKSGDLRKNPLHSLLKNGAITYSAANTRQKLIASAINILLGVKFIDGKYYHVEIDETAQIAIHAMIAAEEEWVPIYKIQKNLQTLVIRGRARLIKLFGGRLPRKGFQTLDGWRTGDLQHSPLNNIFRTGVIRYSHKKPPSAMRKDLENYLFGVKRTKYGYERVTISPEDAKMLDELGVR